MISSIAASQVDVADTDPGAGIWNAIARDLPMRIVADGSRCDDKHCGTSFVVRKDIAPPFHGVADLKGKNVVQFQPGSTLYQLLYRMLTNVNLTINDVKTTQFVAFTDILPAFSNKAEDASWMIEPLATQGISQGLWVRYQTVTQMFGNTQNTMIVYSPNFSTQHKDAGQKFMVAYIKGIRDYLDAVDNNKDYDTVIGYLTKDSTLKDPALYKQVGLPGYDPNGQMNLDSVKSIVDWFVQHGDIKTAPNVDQIYDPSYVNAALQVDGKR